MAYRAAIVLGCSLLVAGCVEPTGVARTSAALGEPQDGFPTWEERVVFVWTNRARADPAADLASCTGCAESACYAPRPPVVWDHALARAARFHADNLALAGCRLQHDSPCDLVADLGTQYTPGPCDGAPSCACAGGTAVCGSSGTTFGARVGLFGAGARAENLATGGDPVGVFYMWLHERDTSPECGWRPANGHRANILGDARSLGVGKTSVGGVWAQDFGSGGTPDGIVGGVHYPSSGATVELRANWYRVGVTPTSARVNVGGVCNTMALERGSGDNGTYLATVSGIGACVRYSFVMSTPAGDVVYPSTGSYGIACPEDWSPTAPPACGCTPACAGRSCGDDGCGSSCGSCAADRTCNASGSCVCVAGRTECSGACVDTQTDVTHCGGCGARCPASEPCVAARCVSSCAPSCGGRSCGDDGCGGSCGTCAGDRACDAAGACVCPPGRTVCGGACVDLNGDSQNCAGCGIACSADRGCVSGVCVGGAQADGGAIDAALADGGREGSVLRGQCGCRAAGASARLHHALPIALLLLVLSRRRARPRR